MSIPLSQLTTLPPKNQGKGAFLSIADAFAAIGAAGNKPSSDNSKASIRGAYLHIPFCFHKCHYCDFYSIVDSRDRQQAFTERLIHELAAASARFQRPIETIFIGGGTPTLLKPHLWCELLKAMHDHLPLTAQTEFTVEANPETVTTELLELLVGSGVNRISVGCQSFDLRHLKTLERWHDPESVRRTVSLLRQAGIGNFNLDLIFGIPGQSLEQWLSDLEQAIALKPSHLSCYGLTYEPNTPLTVKMKAGDIEPIDDGLEAAMYEATIDRLAMAGYRHYEISNWALQSDSADPSANRCRHNMLYWTNADWWAFGPSASGHVGGVRWKNVPRLGEYLDSESLPPVQDVERLDEDGRIGEAFLVGLRLIDGLPLETVAGLLSRGARAADRRLAIDRHVKAGMLVRTDGSLRLTRAGLMLADGILCDLL